MLRKVILTAVFGLVAVGFAWYGLTQAHSAPAEPNQCLQKAGEAAKDGLEKDSDYGGGLLF